MKTRVLHIVLGTLVCLALLAGFSTSGAQIGDSLVPPEDGGGVPKGQLAPARSEAL